MQMEKYKNALEAKNTESGKILDTFKNQIVGLKKGRSNFLKWNRKCAPEVDWIKLKRFSDRDTANEQVNAKEKLIDSYKTQSNTMKQLINRAGLYQIYTVYNTPDHNDRIIWPEFTFDLSWCVIKSNP